MPNNIRQQPMWISTGDPETVDDRILAEPGQLGMKTTIIQPTRGVPGVEEGRAKTYQLVATDSTMTVTPFKGAVAWWANEAQYKVTTDATNRNRIAGVFQGPVAKGNYGFIQTKGPAIVKIVDASIAAMAVGNAVIPSSTNAKADRVAAGTAPTHTVLGWVPSPLTKNAAAAEVVVDLDAPEMP